MSWLWKDNHKKAKTKTFKDMQAAFPSIKQMGDDHFEMRLDINSLVNTLQVKLPQDYPDKAPCKIAS